MNSQPSPIRGVFPLNPSIKNDCNNLYDKVPGSNYRVNFLSTYVEDEITAFKNLK